MLYVLTSLFSITRSKLFPGKGRLDSSDGAKYQGDWEFDIQSGKGKSIFASKDYYTGEYSDGVIHGEGVYTFADGSRYAGRFCWGKYQ